MNLNTPYKKTKICARTPRSRYQTHVQTFATKFWQTLISNVPLAKQKDVNITYSTCFQPDAEIPPTHREQHLLEERRPVQGLHWTIVSRLHPLGGLVCNEKNSTIVTFTRVVRLKPNRETEYSKKICGIKVWFV